MFLTCSPLLKSLHPPPKAFQFLVLFNHPHNASKPILHTCSHNFPTKKKRGGGAGCPLPKHRIRAKLPQPPPPHCVSSGEGPLNVRSADPEACPCLRFLCHCVTPGCACAEKGSVCFRPHRLEHVRKDSWKTHWSPIIFDSCP